MCLNLGSSLTLLLLFLLASFFSSSSSCWSSTLLDVVLNLLVDCLSEFVKELVEIISLLELNDDLWSSAISLVSSLGLHS